MNRIDDAIRSLEKRLDSWDDKKEVRSAEFAYRYRVYTVSTESALRAVERKKKEAALIRMMGVQLEKNFLVEPLDHVMETVMQIGAPVLDEIERLRHIMSGILAEEGELIHFSGEKGLSVIKALSSKPNMYGSENRKCVFASSDDVLKALYAARVTAGGMTVDREKCIFKNDPFSGYREGEYILKRRAYAYILNPEDFMPVIDFTVDKVGKCHIHFEGEWMSEKDSVRPKACFEVDSVKGLAFGRTKLLYESVDGSIVPIFSDEI